MNAAAQYASPAAWARGAEPAYGALSHAIVGASPVPLDGLVVLDLGAGTGTTSRAISAAGGIPVAVDVSLPMLAYDRAGRPPAVVADITALPIGTDAVGGAVSAFSLSHVDQPGDALAECRRTVRPGGPVLAGVFALTGARHPAAEVIEEVATRWGWTEPSWYLHLKNDLEPLVSDEDTLSRLARGAGLDAVSVFDVDVDTGLETAAELVGWRLGGAALAGWVATLPVADRDAVVREAVEAVGSDPQPLRVAVRILSSIVPAAR